MNSHPQEALNGRRAAFLLALLSILVFLPALGNGFVYDDGHYILDNPHIGSLAPDNIWTILTEPYFGNFHPLHHLFIALERAAFGFNPLGWHAVSLILHAINAALLCRILLGLGIAPAVALGGAAIFAVHPLQAESVAWVSEQKNLLSLLFVLLSLGSYMRARRTGRKLPWMLSFLAFVLALASKVSAVALMPVLLAIEILSPPGARSGRQKALVRVLPFVLLAGLWCNLGLLAHGGEGFIHPYPGGSFAAALLTIGPVLMAYAELIIWPFGLSAAYDLPPATGMAPVVLAGAWLGLALLLLPMVYLARRERESRIAIALVWTGAFLLPVLNLVPIGTLLNDRYLYAPLCALGPLAVAGTRTAGRALGRKLQLRRGGPIGAAGLAVILVLLGTLSILRAGVWADEERLWSDAAGKSPGSAYARYNLGTLWLERGRDDLAEPHLRAALEADPRMVRPYLNLGSIHYRQGKFRLAATEFQAATTLEPRSYGGWMGLGSARAKTGRADEAIAAFRRASEINPEAGKPYLGLGLLLHAGQERESARRAFRAFLSSGEGTAEQRRLARERLRNLEAQIRDPGAPGGAGT